MIKYTVLILVVVLVSCAKKEEASGKRFQLLDAVVVNDRIHYCILDENKNTIKKFKNKYFHIWGDTIKEILVVAPYGKSGWWLMDKNENLLFEVYNTTYGEPSPDEFSDGKIRIIDKDGKIGYANEKGKIVIPPQFEMASEFRNNYAIIGRKCKQVPLGGHQEEKKGDCVHLKTECQENGYINEKGEIVAMGNLKFEEIARKLQRPNY